MEVGEQKGAKDQCGGGGRSVKAVMKLTAITGVIYGGPTSSRPWGWTCKLKRWPVTERTVVQAGEELE